MGRSHHSCSCDQTSDLSEGRQETQAVEKTRLRWFSKVKISSMCSVDNLACLDFCTGHND